MKPDVPLLADVVLSCVFMMVSCCCPQEMGELSDIKRTIICNRLFQFLEREAHMVSGKHA